MFDSWTERGPVAFGGADYLVVNKLMLGWNLHSGGTWSMNGRYKPIFYRRRKKRVPAVFVLLGATAIAAYFVMRPSDNPISTWVLSLPSLYQWIPAAIMWLTLLVMLMVSVFGAKKD